MGDLDPPSPRPQLVVDPAAEHRRRERPDPGTLDGLGPGREVAPGGQDAALADELTFAGLDHVGDGFLVNIESDIVVVIHL